MTRPYFVVVFLFLTCPLTCVCCIRRKLIITLALMTTRESLIKKWDGRETPSIKCWKTENWYVTYLQKSLFLTCLEAAFIVRFITFYQSEEAVYLCWEYMFLRFLHSKPYLVKSVFGREAAKTDSKKKCNVSGFCLMDSFFLQIDFLVVRLNRRLN